MKVKPIIMSAVAALTGAAFTVGGSYALFTSESKNNIAVTSGKVAVTATIENVKMYSGVYNETLAIYESVEQTDAFLNGGTATVEDGVVTLDKITPMDKVEFDVKIANESTVAAKYQTSVKKIADDGLYAGLSVKVGENSLGGHDYISDWTVLEPTTTEVATMHVVVELPENAGNEYQNKTCAIEFGVAAVQGNARTVNPPHKIYVSNQDELNTAIASANADTEIVLAPSETIYVIPSISNKDVNIVGEDVENTKIEHGQPVGVSNSTLSFKNVKMVGANNNYVGFITPTKETYEDCIFTGRTFFYSSNTSMKNCTFVQETYEYCFWVYGAGSTVFDGCTFNTLGKAAKIYNEGSVGTFNVTFNGCVFNSSEDTHNKPAVAVDSRGALYNITFNNCASTNFNYNDDAMTDWYTTRMADATAEEKCLIGAEGQIDKVTATINGKLY